MLSPLYWSNTWPCYSPSEKNHCLVAKWSHKFREVILFSISFCAHNTHVLSPTRNFQADLNKQTTHSWVIPAFEMLARNLQSLVIPSPSTRVKQGLVGLTYNPWPCGTIIRILVILGMIRGWLCLSLSPLVSHILSGGLHTSSSKIDFVRRHSLQLCLLLNSVQILKVGLGAP